MNADEWDINGELEVHIEVNISMDGYRDNFECYGNIIPNFDTPPFNPSKETVADATIRPLLKKVSELTQMSIELYTRQRYAAEKFLKDK